MRRAGAILGHPLYAENMRLNAEADARSAYCRHDLAHSLDVARIASAMNLEGDMGFPRESLYAAALLHDITKWRQLARGEKHNETAIAPAALILADAGFSRGEAEPVLAAILAHRSGPEKGGPHFLFARLLFLADKASRPCYACPHDNGECDWELKNARLEW